jgi:hypothetical protein
MFAHLRVITEIGNSDERESLPASPMPATMVAAIRSFDLKCSNPHAARFGSAVAGIGDPGHRQTLATKAKSED